jgi:hypothetical protein
VPVVPVVPVVLVLVHKSGWEQQWELCFTLHPLVRVMLVMRVMRVMLVVRIVHVLVLARTRGGTCTAPAGTQAGQ